MKVEIVAHRGANREAPENTLEAFQRAVEVGVQGIELDIQLTLDGVPVVHHDPSLADGTAGRNKLISHYTFADLRSRDIASLDEVLELVNARCTVYIEIKNPAAVGAVVDRLQTRRSWCAIHSFDHRVALAAKQRDPQLRTGILIVSRLVDTTAAMRAARANDVWAQVDYIDAELVAQVHAAGDRIIAWTVNDVTSALDLAAIGVDAICTDDARGLVRALSLR